MTTVLRERADLKPGRSPATCECCGGKGAIAFGGCFDIRCPLCQPKRDPLTPRVLPPKKKPEVTWLATCGADVIDEGYDLPALVEDLVSTFGTSSDGIAIWRLEQGLTLLEGYIVSRSGGVPEVRWLWS